MAKNILDFIRSKIFEKIAIVLAFIHLIAAFILVYHMGSFTNYNLQIIYIIKCFIFEFFVAAFAIFYNIVTREK